jgi:light-regulated signal transduction histidine kinase (bacteriophytochrome)
MSNKIEDVNVLVNQCDEEPIHLLGRIQSTGFLVAVDSKGVVTHVSENVEQYLNRSSRQLINQSFWDMLGRELVHAIRGAQQQSVIIGRPCYLYDVEVPNVPGSFDVAVHQVNANIVIEFENSPTLAPPENVLVALMKQVSDFENLESLNAGLVEGIRVATGFDRVMLYQFLDDGAGEVIAESKSMHLDTFLGLRYPASDIPKQARVLYKRNLIRHIVDVNDATPSILSSQKGDELDLSASKLRAVSPVHIQYLKNMGVGASMSISVIIDGELWGLIACHHDDRKHVSGRMLSQLELFAEMFSLELSHRLVSERIRVSEKANGAFARVLSNLSLGKSLAKSIVEQLSLVKSLIDIDGIGCSFGEEYTKAGIALSRGKVNLLTEILANNPNEEVYQLDNLVHTDKRLTDSNVAGVLAIRISSSPMDYIFLFRTSVIQHVTWAGNPEKRVEKKDGQTILTPRASFEQWLETNESQSRQWTTLDIERARSLRLGVMELTIRHLHEKEALQREAKKRLELLIGELNHRVRNILNLVSAIVGQTSQTKNDIDSFVTSLSARISALALGHDQLTHASWNSISFRTLLNNELKAYMVNESSFNIQGPSVKLTAYAVTPIVLVFHEMITNAAKYGALSATSNDGRVSITWHFNDDKDLVVQWRELGGPPLDSIESEGFGMTVINSVIPHELGGTVDLFPKVTGLEANFLIPSKYVEIDESLSDERQSNVVAIRPPAKPKENQGKLGSAFVVEDNLLISLDLQKHLKRMGFESIDIFGDIGTVRNMLKKKMPQMMFLDVHLGSENTFQLGIEVKKRGIPFVFITGYGASIDLPSELADATVLTKPVDPYLLSETVSSFGFKVDSLCSD